MSTPNSNIPNTPAGPTATTPVGTPAATANSVVNASTAPGADKVGVFTSPQSLVTFPVATAAVTTIWQVLGRIHKPLGDNNEWVPFIVALLVGALIYMRGRGIPLIDQVAAYPINTGSKLYARRKPASTAWFRNVTRENPAGCPPSGNSCYLIFSGPAPQI